jgi:hypothetical protein
MINNFYESNSAVYGDDIASYAVKIATTDSLNSQIDLENVGPGIAVPSINFHLVDFDDQIMISDSVSQIKIISLTEKGIVEGTNLVKVNKGTAKFSNLVFRHPPGSDHVSFQLVSNTVNQKTIEAAFGNVISENVIDVSFRF